MAKARHYRIHGKVQRVGYRFFTKTCAEAIGVTGWVRNMEDGSVEAHAEGSDEQLAEFAFDLSRGARYARVEKIDEMDAPSEGFDSFEIRR